MDSILNFLADNYIWFLIGGAVLLVALIGFLVDGKKHKKGESNTQETTNAPLETNTNQIPTNQESNVVNNEVQEPMVVSENEQVQDFGSVEPTLTFDTPANEVNEPVISESTNLNGESSIGEPITFETPSSISNTESQIPVSENIEEPVVSVVEPIPVEIPGAPTSVEFTSNEPVMQVPVQDPVMQAPVQEPVMQAPVQEPVMQAPVQEPVMQTPVQEPVMQAPVQEPVMQAPVQEPVMQTPVQEPVAEPIEIQPVENNTNNTTPLV